MEMEKVILKAAAYSYADILCDLLKALTGEEYKFAPVHEEDGEDGYRIIIGIAPKRVMAETEKQKSEEDALKILKENKDDIFTLIAELKREENGNGLVGEIKIAEHKQSKKKLGKKLNKFAPLIEELVICRLTKLFPTKLIKELFSSWNKN